MGVGVRVRVRVMVRIVLAAENRATFFVTFNPAPATVLVTSRLAPATVLVTSNPAPDWFHQRSRVNIKIKSK